MEKPKMLDIGADHFIIQPLGLWH